VLLEKVKVVDVTFSKPKLRKNPSPEKPSAVLFVIVIGSMGAPPPVIDAAHPGSAGENAEPVDRDAETGPDSNHIRRASCAFHNGQSCTVRGNQGELIRDDFNVFNIGAGPYLYRVSGSGVIDGILDHRVHFTRSYREHCGT